MNNFKINGIIPPISKAALLTLVNIANEHDKKKENETDADRMKRLLIKSSVDSVTENVLFHAKMGYMFYAANYLSKDLILDIYDGVKLNFPDSKILLNTKECNMVIHWG
jgi:hypothetical protein